MVTTNGHGRIILMQQAYGEASPHRREMKVSGRKVSKKKQLELLYNVTKLTL